MPFKTPTLPEVDPAEFRTRPFFERVKVMTGFWAENGFGSAKMLHCIYLLKLFGLTMVVGVVITTLTSDVGAPWAVGQWWNEPIMYQKLVLWVALLEVIGVGGAWGPLTGHFKPFYGGARYWLRPGTLRLPPWGSKVPGTAGDTRTVGDAVLYAAVLVSLAVAVLLPGKYCPSLAQIAGDATNQHLVNPILMVIPAVLLILLGLRDKVIFLAARGEQYIPIFVISAVFPFLFEFSDFIIAGKLIIVIVWVGAAASKFGVHFTNVIPPMVSNAPFMPKWSRLAHYRNAPNDLLPSKLAGFMAHVMGTTVELILPLLLLFSTNKWLTIVCLVGIVGFHLFIISTFPLAVPLEWNLLFGYIAICLFLGFPNGDGYGVFDFSQAWMLPVVVIALCFFPVLGNLRPDLVSFLPSMRQYAGNWASAVWAFAPGVEERLNELPIPVESHDRQLKALGYTDDLADLTMSLFVAWRSMHSQGRGVLSVLSRELGADIDRYTVREGEIAANLLVGWNFGDGHLHDERLIAAIQRRLNLAPGDLVVVWVESQPIHRNYQEYKVIDAALGIIERGTWQVSDLVDEQPWLPNGPIPHRVTWRASDTEAAK